MKKVRILTETAAMLALLIVLQWLTKPLGQLVTGSAVNAVLAVTVMLVGWVGGVTVALLSPIFAYVLGIAPQVLTVPVIMLGNAVFVTLLHFIGGNYKILLRSAAAWLSAAVCKFFVLFGLVNYGICGILAKPLLEQGLLKEPMLKALPATFSTPQLITALIGGGLALVLVPVVKKALHRN